MKKVIVIAACILLTHQSAEAGIIKGLKKMIKGTGNAIATVFPGVKYRSMGYGPGGYAGPAAYGVPAPMPGTGTVWGSPQPFITQPVVINGQAGGMLTTMPGGGYTYFGPTR